MNAAGLISCPTCSAQYSPASMKRCPICHGKPLPLECSKAERITVKSSLISCVDKNLKIHLTVLDGEPTITRQTAANLRQLLRDENIQPPNKPLTGLPLSQARQVIEDCRNHIREPQPKVTIRKREKRIQKTYRRKAIRRRISTTALIIMGTIIFTALITAPFKGFDYAYYQILRWTVTGWFAYRLFSQWATTGIFFKTAYALAIITFNPFAPINLDRETWAINDITAAMLIPFAAFWPKTKQWHTRIALILATLGAGATIAYYAGEANRTISSHRHRTPTRTHRVTRPRRSIR